jgi:hypothetical protein
MPENPLKEAKFESVGSNGELVFSAVGSGRFTVEVNETLERAILEAKQIKADNLDAQQPHNAKTLPISQIQVLIRAGAEPEQVAQKYGLSTTLVRRFSASVQTEKQYAIEQFLSVPAPKESRVHSVSELIERTLAAAGIGMESVSWKATRRGLEPWKIIAQFESAGRHVRAEWHWNMHDNAIASLNAAAKKLLGEQRLGERDGVSSTHTEGTAVDDGFSIALNLPGDSVRSARIERAVSAWNTTDSSPTSSRQGNGGNAIALRDAHRAQNPQEPHRQSPASLLSRALPQQQQSPHGDIGYDDGNIRDDAELHNPAEPSESPAASADAAQSGIGHHTQSSELPSSMDSYKSHTSSDDANQPSDAASSSQENRTSNGDEEPGKSHKRKSRRSAVPSWDEILFGD